MIDIRDALYVPGFGISLTKTKDQSLGSPEADFAAMLEEARAAQAKRQAEEASKEPFVRAELTKEDIKELASKYDSTNMTQEEYDSFLDDLIEKGVLEIEDLRYIDYGGDLVVPGALSGHSICIGVGMIDFFSDNPFDLNGAIFSSTWTGARGSAPDISWRPTNSNVLSWAKNMSLWKPSGSSGTTAGRAMFDAANRRYDIVTTLSDTLEAMRRQRPYVV